MVDRRIIRAVGERHGLRHRVPHTGSGIVILQERIAEIVVRHRVLNRQIQGRREPVAFRQELQHGQSGRRFGLSGHDVVHGSGRDIDFPGHVLARRILDRRTRIDRQLSRHRAGHGNRAAGRRIDGRHTRRKLDHRDLELIIDDRAAQRRELETVIGRVVPAQRERQIVAPGRNESLEREVAVRVGRRLVRNRSELIRNGHAGQSGQIGILQIVAQHLTRNVVLRSLVGTNGRFGRLVAGGSQNNCCQTEQSRFEQFGDTGLIFFHND